MAFMNGDPCDILTCDMYPYGKSTEDFQITNLRLLQKIANAGGGTSGGATAANQVLELAHLAAIDTSTAAGATAANQTSELTHLAAIDTATGGSKTDLDAINTSTAATATNTGLNHGKTLKWASGTVASSGVNAAIALVASKRIKVYELFLETLSATAVTVTLQDDTGTPVVFKSYDLQAQTGVPFGVQASNEVLSPLLATTAGQALKINLSAAVTVRYNFSYYTDDAT